MIDREALFRELQDRVLKLRDAIKELVIDAQEEFKQKLLKADALSAQVAALAAEAEAKINERDRGLFELTYLSKVNISADDIDEELRRIENTASVLNRSREISGLLIYRNGHFMQRIEGEKHYIDKLYSSVARDPRHGNITVLSSDYITERLFRDWLQLRLLTSERELTELNMLFEDSRLYRSEAFTSEESYVFLNFLKSHRL
jgi:hypothetical protein